MELLIRLAADGILLLILAVAGPVILYAVRYRFWRVVPVMIMAGLTSLLIGKIMSLLYQPQVARPFLELGSQPGAAYIDNPGFPSDHALLASVAVMAMYAVTKNRKLAAAMWLLVIAMSAARVAALVHTPFDVVAGAIAGLSGAIWYRKLTK